MGLAYIHRHRRQFEALSLWLAMAIQFLSISKCSIRINGQHMYTLED